MPDYLAIDLEQRELCGVEAAVSRGNVKVRRAFRLERPADVFAREDVQEAGRWLGGELRRLGVSARQVLVSLPREDAVVRQLELPNVPDDELAQMVRLQAETKSASSLERMHLDYLPLPVLEGAATRQVLMTTISRDLAARIQSVLQAAGLETLSIGVSSAGAAELVAHVEARRGLDPEETSLLIVQHGGRVEISLMRSRRLLFTHSTRVHGEGDEQQTKLVLAEVSRSFVALEKVLAGGRIARTWVLGSADVNRGLCEALARRLEGNVQPLDPLTDADVGFDGENDPGRHAPFAGPGGLLLAASGRLVEHVDFLNPRKSVQRADRRKVRNRMLGIGAAAAVVLGALAAHLHVRSLNTQIDILSRRDRALTRTLQAGQPTLEFAGQIEQWISRDVQWPDQFVQFTRASPGGDRLFLTSYVGGVGTGRSEVIGTTRLTGLALEREDVDELSQRLVDAGYRVEPAKIVPDRTDSKYHYQFDLDVEWTSRRTESGK